MKISKRQLRRIIKEEKRKLLQESSAETRLFAALDEFVMIMDEELGYNVPEEHLKAAVYEFVDNFFKDSAAAAEYAADDESYSDIPEVR